MQPINKILKTFSITDGLLRGTAIVSNLVTIGAISIISGFGSNALIYASSIQMIITAFLELPAGYLSDQFGAKKVLKISLQLKVIVTSLFVIAVYNAHNGNTQMAWLFFVLEVITDAFANSFLSGSYQSSYLHWYKSKCEGLIQKREEPPKLFIASLAFGIKIRFLIPIFVIGTTIFFYYLGKMNISVTEIQSVFICLFMVFILRIIVWIKVFTDLQSINFEFPKATISLKSYLEPIKNLLHGHRIIFVYAVASSINVISLLYFSGLTFKYFYALDIPKTWAWIYGISFGALLFYIRTAISVLLFPKIKSINDTTLLNVVFSVLTISGIVTAVLFTYQITNLAKLVIVLSFNFIISSGAEMALRLMDSNLDTYTDRKYRATWISAANTIGYIIFGLLTYLIIKFNLHSIAIIIQTLLISFISTYAIVEHKTSTPLKDLSLSSVIRANFKKVFALVTLLLLALDLFLFSYSSVQLKSDDEKRFASLIYESISEPLSQGSFVEAKRRLDKLVVSKAINCADLQIWDFNDAHCDNQLKTSLLMRPHFIAIHIGAKSDKPDGQLNIYFDRSNVIRSIILRFLLSLLFFITLWFAVIFIFRKLSGRIEREINILSGLAQQSEFRKDVINKLSIFEFKQLGSKLETNFELELKISEQNLFNKIAKQVAHDIRSPLTALKTIVATSQDTEERKTMLVDIAKRIEETARDLLNRKKNYSELNHLDLALLINKIVAEKSLNYSGQLTTSLDENSDTILALANESDLTRILSNILNNSIEANASLIHIYARLMNSKVWIDLVDNGSGIPLDVLKKIGKEPVTFGKPYGCGLGLSHAITTIQSWGGDCFVVSELNSGTTVRIVLRTP